MKWIVGLGNPGRRYERSRHNVGFHVVDDFARAEGFEGERRRFRARYSEKKVDLGGQSVRVFLVKPQTYMNLSGQAVRSLLDYHNVSLDEDLKDSVLVIHDDLDLPEGRLRFRARGSSGGHRGVASVISCIGHDRFSRLKIGIGRRDGTESKDFVLEKMGATTREFYAGVFAKSVESLRAWIEEGIETCMNRFNAPPATAAGDERGGE